MTMETSQKSIRVPCPEINSRHITESRFLALDPHTLGVCIREGGIVCRLVPEAIVLQHLGELTQIRLADFDAIAPPELFRFVPDQWALLQLFDGRRTYAEVSEQFRRRNGIEVSEPDLRKLPKCCRTMASGTKRNTMPTSRMQTPRVCGSRARNLDSVIWRELISGHGTRMDF